MLRHAHRLINGSILSNFSRIDMSTADEKEYSLAMTPFNRLAIRLIGIPHLGFRLRTRSILSEARKTTSGGKILDAGCGYGFYSLSLGEEDYQVDAIDLGDRRVRTLARMIEEYPTLKEKVTLHTGSLTALPFATGAYDTIICSEVIEHIADDGKAVSELARTLKPEGRLILTVPHDSRYNQKTYKRFGHERPGYTKDSLESITREYGLSIEKFSYYERTIGSILFNAFNSLESKPLMGLLFYPFYFLYLLDYLLGFGEPNQMIAIARKV